MIAYRMLIYILVEHFPKIILKPRVQNFEKISIVYYKLYKKLKSELGEVKGRSVAAF